MKIPLQFATLLFSLSAFATEVILPPITPETLRGPWEAITIPRPDQIRPDALWHMEIGKKDTDTYLAQMGPGASPCPDRRSCTLWELVSVRISGDTVNLHFILPANSDISVGRQIWIVGKGYASTEDGSIDAKMFYEDPDQSPLNGGTKIYFVKGTWTRDLAEASKTAEKAIKEKRSEP